MNNPKIALITGIIFLIFIGISIWTSAWENSQLRTIIILFGSIDILGFFGAISRWIQDGKIS